ncbi:hypothetical protein Tco_0540674 [Tanacetum coccineum]
MKKGRIFADDNIIPEPDVAIDLGNSISKTKAEEQQEARSVHATHKRLVTEKPSSGEESMNLKKLKGIQFMTEEEQLAADTNKALKASKEASRIQQQSAGSSEGAGITQEGSDEESDKSEEEKMEEEEKEKTIEWLSSDDEEKNDDDNDDKDDDQSIDIEETDDEDKTESDNDDQVMDDGKKRMNKRMMKKPLFVIKLWYQLFNFSPGASLIGTIQEQADLEINSLIDIKIQQKIPTVLLVPLLDVLASVVPPTPITPTPKPLTTPLPTPPITNEALTALVPESEAFTDVLQKVSGL